MEMQELIELAKEMSPAFGVLSVVVGCVFSAYFQDRMTRKHAVISQRNQLQLMDQTFKQQIEILTIQQKREEDIRQRQYAEADRADRLVVTEYIDLLVPRLIEIASIDYIASDNRDENELRRFKRMQRYVSQTELDFAHPEKTLGLRIAFLLFQLVGSMRNALNSRWVRPLSQEQSDFLDHWEAHIEPMICSSRYPGEELLYREQVEIIGSEMVTASHNSKTIRPLNWREFCQKCKSDHYFYELATIVADKIRLIFDEGNPVPPRKAMQCRLAIMAMYLIHLSEESGCRTWSNRMPSLWRVICEWFDWQCNQGQSPEWFLFKYGDVKEHPRN